MDSPEILTVLERERKLLEDFICLSEEQLMLLEDENLQAVDTLLERRTDLMVELTAIEATLGTWITQIRNDPNVTSEMLQELRTINDDIVNMANHIVDIDEQTHARLDAIKERTRCELREISNGSKALHQYASVNRPRQRLDARG